MSVTNTAPKSNQDTNDYLYDQFIDEPDKSPQEQHKDNIRNFLFKHVQRLSEEKKNLNENYHDLFENTISDPFQDPVRFKFDIPDVYRFDELLQTENKVLSKIMLVMTNLIWELNSLKEIAEKRFYPSLATYGDSPITQNYSEDESRQNGTQGGSNTSEDGEKQLQFGRFLPFLMDLWNYVARVNQVVKCTVQQLASLYSSSPMGSSKEEALNKKSLLSFQKVHFLGLFTALADTLGVLITLDEIIRQNVCFSNHLILYKRMISRVLAEPERFGTTKKHVGRVNYLLGKIEGDILDDSIFKSCILMRFDDIPNLEPAQQRSLFQQNNLFKQEFFHNLKTYSTHITQTLGTPQESEKRSKVIGTFGLYLLYYNVFMDTSDKKFFKQLWDCHRKAPVIHLYGNTVWQPGEFLLKWVPDVIRLINVKNPRKEMNDAKKQQLDASIATLAKDVNAYYLSLCIWSSRIESNFSHTYYNSLQSESSVKSTGVSSIPQSQQNTKGAAGQLLVGVHGTLILQGIQLAYLIGNLMKNTLYIHIINNSALTVSQVIMLCRCIEMLKTIESTYHRKSTVFAQYVSTLCEYLSYKIQKILLPLKNRLESKRSHTPTDVDQLSSVVIALNLLQAPPTKKRVLIIRLSLAVALQKTSSLIRDTEFDEVRGLLRRLDMISTFESILSEACDCTLLYWSRTLIHTFFQHVYDNPIRAPELKHIFAAIQDPGYKLLEGKAHHLPDKNALFEAYKQEILNSFHSSIVEPLCQAIETDLRLHIHTSVIGTESIAARRQNLDVLLRKGSGDQQLKDLGIFFKIPRIRFFDSHTIELKKDVGHYLDQTFYNLTTITQRDWKTYEEMRNLAHEKYGLELTNVYLPGQTLEQGLDVLEITRSIHLFVVRFSYNLNNNMFIERCSMTDAKNLNTIHIKHVANSIRTHGTGIMNTTVNFVYKFLGRKFFIFSQFLYDDHIKSRLLKDIRFFKDNVQQQLTQMKQSSASTLSISSEIQSVGPSISYYQYPLNRAEKFVKDIKKLGVSAQGISFLDQFRILITEIGNALGYVRMVRAGGLRYISDAIKFVPDLDQIENFEELCEQAGMNESGKHAFSDQTKQAAKNLYQTLTNLRQKFAEGSDYFKSLEKVFTEEMQKDKNNHLRNFYIIVPPLTLSYVDSMLIAKDKMARTGKEANFTDDGFALGIAFILKILNQNSKFDSLHWFSSIANHYDEEYKRIQKTMNEKSSKRNTNLEEELQTMKLTLNRIQSYKMEFELLFFSFSGSRIFFRD